MSGGAKNNGTPRLEGRNGAIWRAYVTGKTQEAIAEELGIDQSTVSRAIAAVRASIPEADKQSLVQREIDFLDVLRARAIEISNLAAAPVTAGKDGNVVHDPETGAVVRDYSGQLAAMREARAAHERMTKLLGLDAPAKVDVTVTEQTQQAAQAAAADALARLHGGE